MRESRAAVVPRPYRRYVERALIVESHVAEWLVSPRQPVS